MFLTITLPWWIFLMIIGAAIILGMLIMFLAAASTYRAFEKELDNPPHYRYPPEVNTKLLHT